MPGAEAIDQRGEPEIPCPGGGASGSSAELAAGVPALGPDAELLRLPWAQTELAAEQGPGASAEAPGMGLEKRGKGLGDKLGESWGVKEWFCRSWRSSF